MGRLNIAWVRIGHDLGARMISDEQEAVGIEARSDAIVNGLRCLPRCETYDAEGGQNILGELGVFLKFVIMRRARTVLGRYHITLCPHTTPF